MTLENIKIDAKGQMVGLHFELCCICIAATYIIIVSMLWKRTFRKIGCESDWVSCINKVIIIAIIIIIIITIMTEKNISFSISQKECCWPEGV